MKKFRCCFPNCKFKHETLLAVVNHLAKEHNLKINGRKICVHRVYANVLKEEVKDGS